MLADVLLTGASGFVGCHVAQQARVRGLVIASVDGDVRDRHVVLEAVSTARPRAVVHLASALRRSEDPWAALADDVLMTGNVIAAVRELVPSAVVLVPGSAAQYGRGASAALRESDPTLPLTPYGAAKCVLEQICTSGPLQAGVRVIFTRSFNHMGPGQAEDAPVAAWARQVAEAEVAGGGAVRVGRLDVRRDFLDVRDVADAYLDLVQSDAAGVVNVCSGKAVVLADLAAMLSSLARFPVALELEPALVRPSDPPAVVGDPTLLERLTGFRPRISLEQSLADALDEQRSRIAARDVVVRSG